MGPVGRRHRDTVDAKDVSEDLCGRPGWIRSTCPALHAVWHRVKSTLLGNAEAQLLPQCEPGFCPSGARNP
eukprot:1528624-Amphidinium_carterae.1